MFKLKESELVVQALKALGKDRVDEAILRKLAEQWPSNKWRKILRDTSTAPSWVSDIILKITKLTNS